MSNPNYLGQLGNGIAGPPTKMRTGETVYWEDTPFNDRFNNTLDSNSYALQYAFAGPGSPLQVNATAASGVSTSSIGGGGWLTQLTAAQAALLAPAGKWWWQAILIGYSASFTGTIAGQTLTLSGLTGTIVQGAVVTGVGVAPNTRIVQGAGSSWQVSNSQSIGPIAMTTVIAPARIVAAEGELIVEPDLSSLGGVFDGRSTMEIGLATWEAALAALTGANGSMPVKQYTIGSRHLMYQDLKEITDMVNWFRGRVNAEKMKASGGQDRMIRVGFTPPSSGSQVSNSRNWPWW